VSQALDELTDTLTECTDDLVREARRLQAYPDGQRKTRQANAIRATVLLLRVFANGWISITPDVLPKPT
jgi:hypothetical protein